MKHYYLVMDDDITRFVHDLSNLLKAGWRFDGFVHAQTCKGETFFSQMLIRVDKETKTS